MTISQAIDQVDRLKFNACPREDKLRWLLQLERQLQRQILDAHAPGLPGGAAGEDPSPDTLLLAPAPFDRVYTAWLEAMLDLYNGEIERYNAAIDIFNREYAAFAAWYTRHFKPKHSGSWRG